MGHIVFVTNLVPSEYAFPGMMIQWTPSHNFASATEL